MKFGQLKEYIKINIFLQRSCRKRDRELVPGLFLFLEKALYEVKVSSLQLSVNTFDSPQRGMCMILQEKYLQC